MIRPWTRLIAKYPDGIMLFATYAIDPSNPLQNKWQVTAKYRGAVMPTTELNALVKKHIDKLDATVKTIIDGAASINLTEEISKFYVGGKRKSVDYDAIVTDGITKTLSFN